MKELDGYTCKTCSLDVEGGYSRGKSWIIFHAGCDSDLCGWYVSAESKVELLERLERHAHKTIMAR